MRRSVDCPFSTHPDVVPPIWAGRYDEVNDWIDVVRPRKVDGLAERPRMILAGAGLGKSALVGYITERAKEHGDLVTGQLRIPLDADPLAILAKALLELSGKIGFNEADAKIGGLLSRVTSISAKGVAVAVREKDKPEAFVVLRELMIRLGEAAARRRNTVVLIHLDEVQNITDPAVLSQLFIIIGDVAAKTIEVRTASNMLIERHLPVAVYLTGLPEFWDMVSARQGATFDSRFDRRLLLPLSDEDMEMALQSFVLEGWPVPDEQGGMARIGMEPGARDAILDLCQGEPFLFQLAGYHAWYAGDSETVSRQDVVRGWKKAEREALDHVERILERLPETESLMIQALARLAPDERTLDNIAAEMGYSDIYRLRKAAKRLDATHVLIKRSRTLYSFYHRAIEAHLTRDWPAIPEGY